MKDNSHRFDLSDRLIHFFREVNLEGDSAPLIQPEHFAFNSYVEGTKWPALFLLRCAVRSHRLWATWSMRKGVRTVYGPRPAVCFSEMPIGAFLEASMKREAAGQAMSPYALTFLKTAMHEVGTNPVIYGLADRNAVLPKGIGGVPRLMKANILPPHEQYRYVTYNPSGPLKVDWLHEREWRWPYNGDLSKIENELQEYGIVSDAADIPGFDFAGQGLQGIGIIVKTEDDARKLSCDVLTLIDKGEVSPRHFDHILVINRLPSPLQLVSPNAVDAAISEALLDFSHYFGLPEKDVEQVLQDFSARVSAIEQGAPKVVEKPIEKGGCWLWVHDNTHPYVRALIQAGRVTVNNEGRYVASLDELCPQRELRQRQELADKLAKQLSKELGVGGGFFSVLNSSNPSDIPFYIGRPPEDDLYHNTDH